MIGKRLLMRLRRFFEMKKIRILQTPVRFYPYVGGVEYVVYYLSRELVKLGYKVKVICANEPKSSLKDVKGIKVKRLNYVFKIANTNITFNLPYRLLKEDYDIIHTHMPTPWSSDMSIFISRLKNKKTIITIHNDIDKHGFLPKLLSDIYLNTFFKILLNLVDKIIIVNPEWERTFVNTGNILKKYKNKITVIPNGIDLELFNSNGKKKFEDILLFVSILDKHHKFKGFDYLLDSLKIVVKKYSKIKLLVIGEGELKNYYSKKASYMDLEGNVIFLGQKNQDEVAKYCNKASIFILPSIDIEGFGIVLLEAMACKIPVIATDIVGVVSEVIQNNCGIIVKPRDSQALAEAIIRLLKNPKLAKKMGENGRILVEEKYGWEKIAKKVEKIYEEVIK
jgi:glycosyltransferase involved in cell wall biosynthesis